MTEPTTTRPKLPKLLRLRIYEDGEWLEVSCEMCRNIVVSGDKQALAASLSELLARVAPLHLHEGA